LTQDELDRRRQRGGRAGARIDFGSGEQVSAVAGEKPTVPSTSGDDEVHLPRQAAAGCIASFESLARRHQVSVLQYVRHLVRHGGDAEDIVQESLVRAWRRIGTYDPRWAFSTWLFAIARRSWLNQVRSTRRRRRRESTAAVDPIMAHGPAAVAIATERATRLWDVAAAELSEPEFSAVWLRYVEDRSIAEIASVLARPRATVKVILFRARRRLEPLVRDLVAWSD